MSGEKMGLSFDDLKKIFPKHMHAFGQAMTASFSMHGEDRVLEYYQACLKLPKVGRFIDIGAYHPVMSSNTFALSLAGWNGINIDANPEAISRFEKMRPEDTNICIGISDREEECQYHIFGGGLGNTISANHLAFMKSLGAPHIDTKLIRCRPIMDVLLEVLPAQESKIFDYINIDIEGMDEIVAKQLDWELLQPKVVSIEIHFNGGIAELIEHETVTHMRNHNYQLDQYIGPTAFFIRK
jgi:FkbM family methyltransferase